MFKTPEEEEKKDFLFHRFQPMVFDLVKNHRTCLPYFCLFAPSFNTPGSKLALVTNGVDWYSANCGVHQTTVKCNQTSLAESTIIHVVNTADSSDGFQLTYQDSRCGANSGDVSDMASEWCLFPSSMAWSPDGRMTFEERLTNKRLYFFCFFPGERLAVGYFFWHGGFQGKVVQYKLSDQEIEKVHDISQAATGAVTGLVWTSYGMFCNVLCLCDVLGSL